MLTHFLRKIEAWALSRNAPGGYAGEDDPRWAYTIETDGDKYLVRILLPKIFGIRVMLHHILRPDADRFLHNHPWAWAKSLVLSGSYDEERLDLESWAQASRFSHDSNYHDHKQVRWFNSLTALDYHKITRLRGDVWTLFITGPTVQDWGFLVKGDHVPWRTYLAKPAPVRNCRVVSTVIADYTIKEAP